MTRCVDCGKPSKKVKPATAHTYEGITIFGYVCWSCWAEWAPYMHPKGCACDHCQWCLEVLR